MSRRKKVSARTLALLFSLCTCALTAQNAGAHSVYTYTWVEGNAICSESYYTPTSKVQGGLLEMRNPAGQLLARGTTDADGKLCLPAPDAATALEFTIRAGQGHQARYQMPESEVAEAVAAKGHGAGAPEVQSAPPPETPQAERPAPADGSGASAAGPDESRLQAMLQATVQEAVRTELQAQLGPVRQMLARAEAPGRPGWREILGGLGWIAGLAALGYWWVTKRHRTV